MDLRRILELLKYRYRSQRVYVSGDLLVYHQEGVPREFIVPEVFVVKDCDPGRRTIYKTWVEGRGPLRRNQKRHASMRRSRS